MSEELAMQNATPVGASAQAIQDHYDLSNDFYRLWLDSNLVYSGAMWGEENDDLEAAQLRKLDYHIREARAAGAARILDIGCGWGALLARSVKVHGVGRATGITLSNAQKEWIEALALPGVEVRLESWQDHAPGQPYDAIVSIGAFEHFAQLDEDEARKVSNYRLFFSKARELLKRGGRLSLQTFAYGSSRRRELAQDAESTRFLAKEIFRETDPPRLANIAEAIEGHFEIIQMHNDREGYARTCKAWLDNMRVARDKVIACVGEAVYERYQRYLSYSYIGFKSGNLDLYRISLQRVEPRLKRVSATE
jgi:cyclopropane-fatty-acyl-phospholipid synthase